MRRHILSCFLVLQVVLLLCLLPLAAAAADVSGTLEINKKKFKLVHGYIDMVKPEEPVIVLSDKPLPAEQVPFLNADYAVKNKVHAVVFVIIAKDKKISKELALLYTGGDCDSPAVGFPDDIISLDLKRIEETIVEGKIKTIRPKTLTDLTYSFTATFKLSAKAAREKALAPKKVSFTGDDSAPVKAYKDYYRAVMGGDAGAMKKNLAAKSLKEFESMDAKEQEMVLEMMKMRPEALKIAKPAIAGSEATFKAEGKEGTGVSTGTIKMLLEDGRWKVLEDKWSGVIK
ncbi:MAG: hypothetical protein ACHQ0Y_02225 [Thermodesulfovibrionales bacterium]